MKKLFFVLLAAGSATVSQAQVQLGLKAGYNLTTLTQSGRYTESMKSKSEFSAGVLASFPLFRSFYLQPEVLYSGQGANVTWPGTNAKFNYSYLNVPILFKYQHDSGLFTETGPQVGFLLGANIKANGQSTDVKYSTQPVDFSWTFGIGYKIPVVNAGLDARYNLGLTNVNKVTDAGNIKNSVFQFGLFYIFSKI